MNKLLIIFLDIDGVLNPYGYNNMLFKLRQRLGNQIKNRDQFGDYFAPYSVAALDQIIEATNAKIVISSTWRMSGLDMMKSLWNKRRLPGEIYDITPHSEIGISFHSRGEEIEHWLSENTVDGYVVIDDMADMLSHQNFVQTNSKIGLTEELADKCIELLKIKT